MDRGAWQATVHGVDNGVWGPNAVSGNIPCMVSRPLPLLGTWLTCLGWVQDAASLTAVRVVSASSVQGRKVSFVGTVIYEEPGSLGLESCEGPCLCLWSQLDHLLESRPWKGWHLCSQPPGGGGLCAPRGPAGPHQGGRRV